MWVCFVYVCMSVSVSVSLTVWRWTLFCMMQCGINFNWTYPISVAELNLIDQSKVLDKNQELVVPIEIQAELTEPMTEQESKIQYDEVGWEEGKEDEDSEKSADSETHNEKIESPQTKSVSSDREILW